jgi:hypothetical protein
MTGGHTVVVEDVVHETWRIKRSVAERSSTRQSTEQLSDFNVYDSLIVIRNN